MLLLYLFFVVREGFDEIGKKIKREIDALSQMGRRQILGGHPPGMNLNTITPCAACKLLRRRCAEECPFSPYFSPHEPHKFAAGSQSLRCQQRVKDAHVNVCTCQEVPESQRPDAANSLVYEANVRLGDPVYGCMGAISALQQQVQSLQAELHAVRAEILRFKYREATNNLIASAHAALATPEAVSVAVLPPPSAPPPPPPPPPPLRSPPPSVVVSSSGASSNLYNTLPASTMGYNSIPSDGVPYFD
ncbi:LOB domain-containing protein 15 [Actinidia rufa]|uniref:LOB domain-containing protein 15 n=1 Tax=Actinidia rufa TaxID=165716 RepID=A0A7J0FUW6_9ERIC|nr:LOB domain-containing protein 15 [Actinidia rufa]